jgi:hypothetical protein
MLVREKLHNVGAANLIAALRSRLGDAGDLSTIRGIESRAAAEYWGAWSEPPILFPRKDANRVPKHWLTFGTRHSPLTGGPRLSINPANSILNYTNAIAESECRLAACACGLDPGLGVLHTDTANRDSLALDLIETIRPAIEAWLLDWLMREPLSGLPFERGGWFRGSTSPSIAVGFRVDGAARVMADSGSFCRFNSFTRVERGYHIRIAPRLTVTRKTLALHLSRAASRAFVKTSGQIQGGS